MSSPSKLSAPAFAAAVAIALASCASMPTENPRLTQVEGELRAAYSDKYAAEYGHADLAKAEVSLTAARAALGKGHDGEMQHDLTMAESYINLGGIHGRQESAKAETAALKDRQDQIRLAARDRDVRQANNRAIVADAAAQTANDRADMSQADALAANAAVQTANDRADTSRTDALAANAATQDANDRANASRVDTAVANAATQNANDRADSSRADAAAANAATRNAQAATQTAQDKTAAMRDQLRMYDMKVTELGATLVLRDVMFDTDSALLREGAVKRLDPLITYLRASPATSVRIEGHTDNSGSMEHNKTLSLDRANAVKRALLSDTTVSNTIGTYGYGQSKPIATNGTVSGREQNRRVEITLQ